MPRLAAIRGPYEAASTLHAIGPDRWRLGRKLTKHGAPAEVDGLDLSTDPVQVSGTVDRAIQNVAVVAGGRVVAVVPAAKGRFWALVPRSALNGTAPTVYSLR